MSQGLGPLLESLRSGWKAWLWGFIAVLALLVVLNYFIRPHEPHFGLDGYPGFFAGFGLVVGVAMVVIMKKVVQPWIARKEDFYDVDD